MQDDRSTDLMARWRQGDQEAAAELFRQYAGRLIALARSRLPAHMSQRFDPEDVVQSAYRSFFARAREGGFDIQPGNDLWQLLVGITIHKLQHQVRRNTADKRAVFREQPLEANGTAADEGTVLLFAQEPSPIEAVTLIDEVEQLMARLEPMQRRILELRLQGYDREEIAADIGRSEVTVRRVLKQVQQQLEALQRGGEW
jgi:RNA polymerase sigma factor (sigma-70 family)